MKRKQSNCTLTPPSLLSKFSNTSLCTHYMSYIMQKVPKIIQQTHLKLAPLGLLAETTFLQLHGCSFFPLLAHQFFYITRYSPKVCSAWMWKHISAHKQENILWFWIPAGISFYLKKDKGVKPKCTLNFDDSNKSVLEKGSWIMLNLRHHKIHLTFNVKA